MDINEQVSSIFSSFIRDLSKTFPEIKNCLYRNYETEITNDCLKIEDCPKIRVFLDIIQENEGLIKMKDESFFDKDIELLEDISFKRLWERNISIKTKNTIWKYLKTFSIININLNSSQQLKSVLESLGKDEELNKEDIKDKKTARDLRDLKQLTEEVTDSVKSENENDLEQMLGGMLDSDIGKIAKEVAETMNIKDMLGDVSEESDPMQLMSQLFNPEKMGSIFENINQIMTSKMESGDLDPETLKKEAENMYGNMSDNPMFASMMGQMDTMETPMNTPLSEEEKEAKKEKLRQKIREKEATKGDKNEKLRQKIVKDNEEHEMTKDERREKLRQKIKEKEKQRRNN